MRADLHGEEDREEFDFDISRCSGWWAPMLLLLLLLYGIYCCCCCICCCCCCSCCCCSSLLPVQVNPAASAAVLVIIIFITILITAELLSLKSPRSPSALSAFLDTIVKVKNPLPSLSLHQPGLALLLRPLRARGAQLRAGRLQQGPGGEQEDLPRMAGRRQVRRERERERKRERQKTEREREKIMFKKGD